MSDVKISHSPKKYKYNYTQELRCPHCKILCDTGETLSVHSRFCEKREERQERRNAKEA